MSVSLCTPAALGSQLHWCDRGVSATPRPVQPQHGQLCPSTLGLRVPWAAWFCYHLPSLPRADPRCPGPRQAGYLTVLGLTSPPHMGRGGTPALLLSPDASGGRESGDGWLDSLAPAPAGTGARI